MGVAVSSSNFASSSVNMTTEGTEDWLTTLVGPSTTLRALGSAHKRLGGRMLLYFDWTNPGLVGTGFTQASTITKTSTAADTFSGTAVNSNQNSGFFHASQLDMGWRIRIHASEVTRRLRVYTSHFSSIMTVRARLDGVDTVATFDSGAAAAALRRWTIDYSSNFRGAELVVSFNITTGHGSTPNILFAAATLGRP